MADGFYCFGKLVVPPQTSIHPRVVNGRSRFPKQNTAAPEGNPPGKCLRKTLKRLQARSHARDLSVKNCEEHHNKNVDWNAAFRRPGSMKP